MKYNGMANAKANGAAIRAIREAKGRSLREMASGTGYDRGGLSKIENGLKGASEEALATFADWLNVPIEAISHPAPVLIQATPENFLQITELIASGSARVGS